MLLQGGCRPGEEGGEAVIPGFREAFLLDAGIDADQALEEDVIRLDSQFDSGCIVQALLRQTFLPAPEVVAGSDLEALSLLIGKDKREGQGSKAA